jgi:hypothetical protein
MEAVISKENTSWEIVKLSSVADIIAVQSLNINTTTQLL